MARGLLCLWGLVLLISGWFCGLLVGAVGLGFGGWVCVGILCIDFELS